ncbi:uncharacterized protein [Chelonus insularis]|uniref:uncharacterized protein n=1 Tax=Chelonus insularis TaxID=460826 RepID=UPI00158BCB36|nr:uncharacterized protein LOC118065878 [Chelonus insularis]
MTEEVEYNLDDVIIIADQESLIESLIKNLGILQTEARHCVLIESEFESNFYHVKEITSHLSSKLEALSRIAEKLDNDRKNATLQFVEKIHRSWYLMTKKLSEEHAGFFVASRTVYGVALTRLLSKIKKEVSAMNVSLKIGELVYDESYLIKGYMYFNELTKLLKTLEGCDEKVQQYLMVSKLIKHLEELDSIINQFANNINLLSSNGNECKAFLYVSQLLTGELLGWDTIDPKIVLNENALRKPVFITRNNRRTQLKSLRHLPLFH